MVQVRVFQNKTLDEMGGAQAFLRRISVSLTPEAVSSIGIKRYAATNKGLTNNFRGLVMGTDGYQFRRLRGNLL